MHIIKPSWLSHSGEQKDFEVYSCHVSPDGKRLATAGGDGHVRVWSTESVYNANTPDYNKPRQLCHMSHHLGTIHSVRFSPNGRYLASGADDKIICVYHLDKSPPAATFGTNEPPPIENWKTYKRLIGHDNDVQDLAWSYDSSILVSVGLDSKVVVWSGHTFEKLKTLPAHQSHVKGITFDPANKFFATASDDRTIKIFRFTSPAPNATQHDMVNNFVLETTISSPFKSSPLTTYFRRCSWSPDGNHIAAANAVNGPVSSVAIIERTRWDSEINLIGHEAPTEVCMFSPRLFHTSKPDPSVDDKSPSLVTVIASAGQDKTLSIWNTNTSRPVVILQDLAGKSVSDLAWTPDGQTLFASSLDGSIVVVKFGEGELGWVAQPEENDKALQKYGASRKGMGIAEDVDGLMLENQSKAGESRAVESRMGALMGDLPDSTKESTPVTNGTKSAAPTSKPATNGSAEMEKEKEPEKEPEKQPEEAADKTASRVKELKSRVTIGKDGKKRVAPLLVSSSGTGTSSLPQTQLVGTTSTNKAAQNDAPQTSLDLTKPFDGLPKGGIAAMLLGNKRKLNLGEAEEDEEPSTKRATTGPTPIVTNGPDGVEPAALVPVQNGVVPTPEFLRPAVMNPSISFAQVRLAVPKIRSHILRPLDRGVLHGDSSLEEATKTPENIILEAKNDSNPRDPSHVIVSKRGGLIWEEWLPRAIILVTATKHFWAVACEDGSIHTWTPAGRRLLTPIILESQPVILEARDHWLMCITATGLAHVWDLKTQSSPNPPVSLGPILDIATTSLNQHSATPGPGITSAHLNSTGHVIVTLTNGDGYYYAREMFTWQRLSEAWWAVGSQYWNSNDSSISALQSTAVGPASKEGKDKESGKATVSSGIIPFLERHTTNEYLLKGRAYGLQRIIKMVVQRKEAENLESSVSIAHLETRIAGALQLGAREEFRLYLFTYAKRLGAEGARVKVEELLSSLLGGILEEDEDEEEEDDGNGWFSKEGDLCGWDRKELLRDVVMILGKYRELQRLTLQYAKILDISLEDGPVDVEHMDVEA